MEKEKQKELKKDKETRKTESNKRRRGVGEELKTIK